jgi:hypothetical protein
MEAMRQSWSDDRLDHLNYRVEEGFRLANEKADRIETSVSDLRAEMNHHFDRIDNRFDRTDARFDRTDGRFDRTDNRFDRTDGRTEDRFDRVGERFDRLEDRFDRLQQGIMIVGGGLVGSLIATLGGLFVSLN